MIDIDYTTLAADVESGALRERLEDELTKGFRAIHDSDERLPTASHYAAQIAAIIGNGAAEPLPAVVAFDLYQEVLIACERARATVLGEG